MFSSEVPGFWGRRTHAIAASHWQVAANPYPLNFVSFPGGTPEVEDGGSDTLGSVNQSRMLSPTPPATGAAGGADTVPINRDMLREKRHAEDREDALRAFREERRRLRELEGGGEGIVEGEEDEEELLRLQQQQGRPGMSPIQVNPPSSIRESGSMSSGGKEGGHARQESYITDIHNDPSLYENPNMDKMAAFLQLCTPLPSLYSSPQEGFVVVVAHHMCMARIPL